MPETNKLPRREDNFSWRAEVSNAEPVESLYLKRKSSTNAVYIQMTNVNLTHWQLQDNAYSTRTTKQQLIYAGTEVKLNMLQESENSLGLNFLNLQ